MMLLPVAASLLLAQSPAPPAAPQAPPPLNCVLPSDPVIVALCAAEEALGQGERADSGDGERTAARTRAAAAFRQAANLWWFWLIAGIFWVVVALVVIQFDGASITAVGMMIGFMFLLVGLQNVLFGAFVGGAARWILWIFGVLFLVAGVVLMISPEETFAGVADILGFIFLLVGIFWLLEALTERDTTSSGGSG